MKNAVYSVFLTILMLRTSPTWGCTRSSTAARNRPESCRLTASGSFGEKSMGLVADIFTEDRIKKLPGHMAIGHNRYSTTGDSIAINIQPILVNFALGGLALAHNGNLVNAGILKDELEAYGSIFQSTMDSEVIIHLIAQSRMATLHERIIDALSHVQGAYSLLIITEDELIAVRDPNGFRPLSLAELDDGYVVASETCAFDLIEATYIRDIAPGEMVVINSTGIQLIVSFPTRGAVPLYFRVHLFCQTRQHGLRPERVYHPEEFRQTARPRDRYRGRCRDPGP